MASTTSYGTGLAATIRVNLAPEEAAAVAKALDASPVGSELVAWLTCSLTEFARSGRVQDGDDRG